MRRQNEISAYKAMVNMKEINYGSVRTNEQTIKMMKQLSRRKKGHQNLNKN